MQGSGTTVNRATVYKSGTMMAQNMKANFTRGNAMDTVDLSMDRARFLLATSFWEGVQ